jgi:hypothetical protein
LHLKALLANCFLFGDADGRILLLRAVPARAEV